MGADNGQEQESVERTAFRSPRPWCGSGIPQANAPNKAQVDHSQTHCCHRSFSRNFPRWEIATEAGCLDQKIWVQCP